MISLAKTEGILPRSEQSHAETFNEGDRIKVVLAEVKGPVMDFLKKAGFVQRFGEEKIFLSTHLALKFLTDRRARDTYSI